ncbi:MAG: D-alanine--D-alanine ligase [Chloroflexi bacterium]|nr:D-alanine--D-alanine ligase [Chloroflexota bacterium]
MSDGEGARRRLRVGVVFGGRTGEHEVSLASAKAVMESLERAGHEVVPIGITPEGRWLTGGDPLRRLSSGEAGGERPATMLPEPGHTRLMALTSDEPAGDPLDVVFPVLHGTYGEDGTVQGLLELAGLPYVGAGVLASAVGLDKGFQKTLWRGLGLPVVPFVSTTRREIERAPESLLDRAEASIGYPCFSKPSNLGSSVGVHKAQTRAELLVGLRDAARYDTDVLIEKAVDARELECSVLGNDEPVASVVGEIVPNAEFYSYRAKYLDGTSRSVIPADVPPAIAETVRELAVRAFASLRCSGLARVDFFLERGTGRVLLNEINTMPGFTTISMYPKLWEASGLPFAELVDRLVRLALERYHERSRNETRYQGTGHGAQGTAIVDHRSE